MNKSKGFALLLLTLMICMAAALYVRYPNPQVTQSEKTESSSITLVESGRVRNYQSYFYQIFVDEKTGRRILSINNSLVLLPEK